MKKTAPFIYLTWLFFLSLFEKRKFVRYFVITKAKSGFLGVLFQIDD